MAQLNLSILKISGDENDYKITDETAQQIAQNAQSTAEDAQSTASAAQSTASAAQSTASAAQSTASAAQSTANSKLKSVTLTSDYDSPSKTLTVSLNTSTT